LQQSENQHQDVVVMMGLLEGMTEYQVPSISVALGGSGALV
jgi:hypothetical protein